MQERNPADVVRMLADDAIPARSRGMAFMTAVVVGIMVSPSPVPWSMAAITTGR